MPRGRLGPGEGVPDRAIGVSAAPAPPGSGVRVGECAVAPRRRWLGPIEARLEDWVEERLAAVAEPRLERWLDRWTESRAGRRLLAAAMADVAADALAGGAGGGETLLADMLVDLVARLGRQEGMRRRLLAALGAEGGAGGPSPGGSDGGREPHGTAALGEPPAGPTAVGP